MRFPLAFLLTPLAVLPEIVAGFPAQINTTLLAYKNGLNKRQVCLTATPGAFTFSGSNAPFLTCTGGWAWFLQGGDGNFVVYQNGVAKWNSMTGGRPPCGAGKANSCTLSFQNDGNLVEYYNGAPIFYTNTGGGIGKEIVFQTTAPWIYIINAAGAVVWHT